MGHKLGSIDGVIVKELRQFPDDRGFLMEVFKDSHDFVKKNGINVRQTTFTVAYPGTIKAWHYHERQWDLWFFTHGKVQVGLYDLRKGSRTKGNLQLEYPGDHNRILIAIPTEVAHGYRVLGNEPAELLYHTTESYDPKNPDEKRLPWDSSKIGFDWRTKFK